SPPHAVVSFFFFFQAEDGIRDRNVTGVQTCALPIYEICSDRPIALSDAGHHTLWVNSLALKLAGIDATTPQPHNGHIHRNESGEPTGYLNESAAELVGAIIPPASPDEMYAGLLNAQQHLWSIGVTGWHEAVLGDYHGKADGP